MSDNKTGAINLSGLVARLGGELRGLDIAVSRVAPLDQSGADAISFFSNPKLRNQLTSTQAAAVIVRPADADGMTLPCIVTADPYLYFTRVAQLFTPLPKAVAGVHPTAVVAADAQIDPSAEIGPLAVVESGAKIGARTIICSGCVIGAGTTVGADCLFYPRVVVYHDCVIGERVIVHAGAVIGSDGFGNAWARDHWEKIPQSGRAIIGDDVEIGSNTTIDRGALGDTVIGRDVRLDNLVHVAHNVEIGTHTAIAACTGIAGSTTIGAGCLIGGAAMISGHLKIADRVSLSGGCGVVSDIDEPGTYSSINPALPQTTWRRVAVHYRHLDKLVQRVKALEKQLKLQMPESEDLNKENAQ